MDDELLCICNNNGCALCLGDEWPEREAEQIREKYGDRHAIELAIVPLFGIREEDVPY